MKKPIHLQFFDCGSIKTFVYNWSFLSCTLNRHFYLFLFCTHYTQNRCFKCSRCVFKCDSGNKLIEHFHIKHLSLRKTKRTRQTIPEILVKIPQFDGADDDNDNEKKSDQDRYYKQTTHNVKMFGNLLYFHEFFLLSPQSKKRFHYCRTLVPSTATAAKERSPR